MSKAVFGIATSEAQAEIIVHQLKDNGFSFNDISVLFPDTAGTKHFAHEQHTKAPEGAAAGAGTGGVLGAGMGWIIGAGLLAVPGLGVFVAAGPLMAALAGAAVGAALGGIAGALVGMGIPEYEAKRYETQIRKGNILISVHCERVAMAKLARDIFENAGAEDIGIASEASVKKEQEEAADRVEDTGSLEEGQAR